MLYLTYDEYTEMGGTLEETTFNDFEFEAESIINWYTFNRLKNEESLPTEVKRCMYRLISIAKLKADAMQLGVSESSSTSGSISNNVTAMVQSQSNDGVSISYNVLSASELFDALQVKTKGGEVEQIVQKYLDGVINSLGQKVLYRGFYPGE